MAKIIVNLQGGSAYVFYGGSFRSIGNKDANVNRAVDYTTNKVKEILDEQTNHNLHFTLMKYSKE